MASNIQKSNQQTVFEAISADTGVSTDRIQQFMKEKGISDPSTLVADESLLLELMESGKGAIEPATPSKPAPKRGRKPKNTGVPANGIQHAQSKIGGEIQAMEEQIDTHLTQWEDMKSDQLAERFEAVPANIAIRLSEKLGGYSDDADRFRAGFDAALHGAFPLV